MLFGITIIQLATLTYPQICVSSQTKQITSSKIFSATVVKWIKAEMTALFQAFSDITKIPKEIHGCVKDCRQRRKEKKLARSASAESNCSYTSSTDTINSSSRTQSFCYTAPFPIQRQRIQRQRSDSECSSREPTAPLSEEIGIYSSGQSAAMLSSNPTGWGIPPHPPTYQQSQEDYGCSWLLKHSVEDVKWSIIKGKKSGKFPNF